MGASFISLSCALPIPAAAKGRSLRTGQDARAKTEEEARGKHEPPGRALSTPCSHPGRPQHRASLRAFCEPRRTPGPAHRDGAREPCPPPNLTHLPRGAAHHGEVPGEGFLGDFPFVEVRGKRRGDQSPSLPRERESFPLHHGGAAGAAGPFRFFPAPLLRIEPEKTQGQHLNSRHN